MKDSLRVNISVVFHVKSVHVKNYIAFYMAHDTFYMAHDTFYMARDTFYMAHDTFYMVHDTLYMAHDTFYMAHDTFYMAHDTFTWHTTLFTWYTTLFTWYTTLFTGTRQFRPVCYFIMNPMLTGNCYNNSHIDSCSCISCNTINIASRFSRYS